jgi:hypothetical protein
MKEVASWSDPWSEPRSEQKTVRSWYTSRCMPWYHMFFYDIMTDVICSINWYHRTSCQFMIYTHHKKIDFSGASRTIMDNSLQVISPWYASWLQVMELAQTEIQSATVENFLKEYVPLIQFLSTIFKFTVAVGRILTNSQLCCILLCSSHRDPNIFWPKWVS